MPFLLAVKGQRWEKIKAVWVIDAIVNVSVPKTLARNLGFSAVELRRVQSLVVEHREKLLKAWHGYFGTDRG
ncbi:MAG: DUF4160 domain-containing protein [Acidobacteriia bacterium]|nr:DUF4160 domain-containing protein [Terriglobia bacterium]